jgi:hypothetical protein
MPEIGSAAIEAGAAPTGITLNTSNFSVSMTETVLSVRFTTNARWAAGVTATVPGFRPTGTEATGAVGATVYPAAGIADDKARQKYASGARKTAEFMPRLLDKPLDKPDYGGATHDAPHQD